MLTRRLTARDPNETHRAATQLELFFDLVIVIGLAALTASMHHEVSAGHGLESLPMFAMGFVSLWWIWTNFTWFATSFDNDDSVYRFLVMIMMGGAAMFAGGIAHIFATQDATFGTFGWVIMRLALVMLWLRAARHNPQFVTVARIYAFGLVSIQILWVTFVILVPSDDPNLLMIGGLLFLLEIAVPFIADRFGHLPFHRKHLIERYGLLNIIVLGEGVLSVALIFGSLHGQDIDVGLIFTGVSAMAVICAMWWFYFLESEEHLASSRHFHVGLWSFTHVLIFGGGTLVGAGMAAYLDVLTDHSHTNLTAVSGFTNGSIAAYVFGLWLVRDVFLDIGWRSHVPLVTALILLLACFFATPLWVTFLILASGIVLRSFSDETAGHLKEG